MTGLTCGDSAPLMCGDVIFSCSDFTTEDLRGTSVEQLFTNVEADLRVADGDVLVYEEVRFPVAELASVLLEWIREPESERPDFVLDSMSFAEKGVISITRAPGGWRIGSVFSPGVRSGVVDDSSLLREIRRFAGLVRRDVIAAGIDPAFLAETRGT
ncbi:hypothetical protein [Streptomyces sp. SID161]|uniref:DUF7878 domain-containing protein n=1 Tax=Streptomyces sp. SID161 TaxID=2690251 RepID=UPI00136E0FFE|nr:hypothetical protein [Streptomyces sp. SID161]MYW48031.1 hypothetical protein [Streptomyces sp. SID161]